MAEQSTKEPSKRLAMLWKCLISVGGMCSVDGGVEYLHDCRPGVSLHNRAIPPHSGVCCATCVFLPDWARDEVGGEEVEGRYYLGGRRYYRYNSETSGRIENEQHECRSQLPSTSTVDSSGLWWMTGIE